MKVVVYLVACLGIMPLQAQQTVRLTAGGASSNYVGADGVQWLTDRYFTGGDVAYTADSIGNTVDDYLYRTARRGVYGDFSYRIPVPNGSYKLTLKFAELFFANRGDRVFNVVANGQTVLDHFDILAEVPPRTALDKSSAVEVTGGALELQFRGVVHFGIVSAIAVEPAAGSLGISVSPSQVSLGAGQTAQFTVAVSGASSSAVTWSATSGTISSTGLYTAPASIPQPSSATVTATSVADRSRSASATVALKTPVQVSLNPASGSVASGLTLQLTASVTGSSDTRVTWSSTAGSVSSTGLFTAPNATSAVVATVTAKSVADPSVSAIAQITVNPPGAASSAAPVYVETGGRVAIEAEHGAIVNRAQSWTPQTAVSGYAGSGYLTALPNNGTFTDANYAGSSPEVRFQVRFSNTGKYYIWIRGYAAAAGDDSVHTGFDGAAPASTARIAGFPTSPPAWEWSNVQADGSTRATFTIGNGGLHTVNVWMREDGFAFDRILLTTDAGFSPKGTTGPAESPTDTGGPVLSLSTSNLAFSSGAGSAAAAQSISVGNAGSGTVSWSASDDQTWLSVSPSSGTNSGSLSVSANAASLSAGNYSGSVTVSAPGAAGSPKTVNVTYSVIASAPPPPSSPPPSTGSGRQWYVSPGGSSSGDGSQGKPWDLATALRPASAIKPGDTVWLRGGTYGDNSYRFNSRLAGTSSQPIVVRQYPGERATINGSIEIHGPYTWFWGFEVMNSRTDRSNTRGAPDCIDTYEGSTGVKLINLALHDCAQGIGFWRYAVDGEAYGNLIYHNGWQGPSPDRGHGHGIYLQNVTGTKTVADNIIFSGFALGIQAYGSSDASVQNVVADGNIIFNNGVLSSGAINVDNILFAVGSGLRNITVTNNFTYHTPSENDGYSRLGWSWSPTNDNITVRDNYWIGGESALEVWNWNRATFTGNTVYSRDERVLTLSLMSGQSASAYNWNNNRYFGSGKFYFGTTARNWTSWKSTTGLDSNGSFTSGTPTGVWVFVRRNKYESGRSHIVIYNWDLRSSVDVDLSSVVRSGAQYEIRDAQNFFGPPVAGGTYGGGKVSVPMSGLSVATPVGRVGAAAKHTGTDFGAFVILTR